MLELPGDSGRGERGRILGLLCSSGGHLLLLAGPLIGSGASQRLVDLVDCLPGLSP